MPKVRVAIVGVGNCASALVQGVHYYASVSEDEQVPGVMHVKFGSYHIGDIEFVAAFDVNRRKIGKDLADAIFIEPNNTVKFTDVPRTGVIVKPGPILDGVASHMRKSFMPYEEPIEPVNVVEELKEAKADVVVNFLPVGSERATAYYANAAIRAKAAFVNCIPVFIASDPSWAKKFEDAGLPVLGDDVKSQIGATILHRAIVRLLHMRGVVIEETYQLNVGGDTDFRNMLAEERLVSKRISKTKAVTSLLPYGGELEEKGRIRIGPSDYIPFLRNKKIAYIYVRGRKFGDIPVKIDVKLEVVDSPNSAGVVIDAIRAAKIALDRGMKGAIIAPSAYFFKHPPRQAPSDEMAREWVEMFIKSTYN